MAASRTRTESRIRLPCFRMTCMTILLCWCPFAAGSWLDLTGQGDETLRCSAHITEGITGQELELPPLSRGQHRQVGWGYDPQRIHVVVEVSALGLEDDVIAGTQVFQSAKDLV